MPIDFANLTTEEIRNFEFLCERKLSQLAAILIEENNMSLNDAFHTLYNSDLYSKLTDPRSGLYIQSTRYLYSYLENELQKIH